jgi:hypothetical protein
MINIPSKVRSEGVETLCRDFDLSDPFRILAPDTRDYTYVPSGVVQKNRSRIDFFLFRMIYMTELVPARLLKAFHAVPLTINPSFLIFKGKKEEEERASTTARLIISLLRI